MELHAYEPGMVRDLDDLRQKPVGRETGEAQAGRLKLVAIARVDLVAVAVALGDARRAVDCGDLAALGEHRLVSAEPHRAAERAVLLAPLELFAFHPFRHEADDRLLGRAKFGRTC